MKINKLLLKLTFFVSAAILINACAPAYIPNVVNAPMLNNKGESQLALNAALSGFDAQIAFAPTNHIGLIVNTSFKNTKVDSSQNYHKHSFIEGGIGYYTTFASVGHIEFFAGYGGGKTDITESGWNVVWHVKASYQRIFFQPNVGFSSKIMDIALSPRLVYVIMKPEQLQYSTINKFFLEPTGTLKLGFKVFFLSFQAGIVIPLSETESAGWFDYNPFIGSFGVHFKLFRIYNEKPRN